MTETPSPKRRKGNPLVAVAIVAALAAAVAVKAYEIAGHSRALPHDPVSAQPLDRPAPAFELKDRQGNPVKLSDFAGRWVFLNFWATWCESCRVEMPSMDRLAKALAGEDFAMLAVTVDESWEPVDRFFGEVAPEFRVLHDDEAKWATAFGTTKFPETYLVGPDGRLKARFVGPRDWSDPAFERYFSKAFGR